MKKIWLTGLFIGAILVAAVCRAQGIPYVRKQLEPKFFMPEEAKLKPEKLPPPPRYFEGREDTIKAANYRDEAVEDVKETERVAAEEQNLLDDLENTPEYQQKYDDYTRDLEHINVTGNIPENETLRQDLQEMNSNSRRVVEKKPFQPRPVKAKFNKALQESLNSN